MKITETINMFVERKPYKKNGEQKTFYKLTATIASKKKDETYIRKSITIVPNEKRYPESVLAKLDPNMMYTAEIINGWLIVDAYVNKDGDTKKEFAIYIDEFTLKKATPIDLEKREKGLAKAKGKSNEENTGLPF